MDYEIGLQWFASAEEEGRTEEPSEYKLRKAREEGRVAKSAELNGALVFLAGALSLVLLSKYILAKCLYIMRYFFTNVANKGLRLGDTAKVFFLFFLQMVLPVALFALLAGVASNLIQNRGFLFTLKPITPDPTKIVPKPAQYLKKTLFSNEGMFNVAKSVGKVAVICFIAYLYIRGGMDTIFSFLHAANVDLACREEGRLAAKLLLSSGLFFLVISIPDYVVQRAQFMESMKMSKQEVKQEYKDMEGDPDVKGHLQQVQRQLLQANMPKAVAEADVLVTNPTHFAVALKYDEELHDAPAVTAKGEDHIALHMREIAHKYDVPIVENRALARGLYTDTKLGDVIPDLYIRAIATVYAQIDYINRKKKV